MENETNNHIQYDEALILKELGFDEYCTHAYNHLEKKLYLMNGTEEGHFSEWLDTPTYNQVFTWFKIKYDLLGIAWFDSVSYCYEIKDINTNNYLYNADGLKSFNDAEMGCLRELIKIVKHK